MPVASKTVAMSSNVTTHPPVSTSRLLTPDEVAEHLGVPRLAVIRRSRAGKIPCVRIGKVYRYRSESIERWLVEQEAHA